MKFLADENVEKSIVQMLRESGHDVAYVAELLPGCADAKVIKLARAENRILITNDTDFGDMVFRQKEILSGVVLMRFASELVNKKCETVKHLLKYHQEKLVGHFTVISENQIKIRPIS